MISRHIIKWKIPICYSTPANKIIISVVCCTQSNKHLLAKWRCSHVNIMTIAHFYSFLLRIHQINRRNSILFSCQYWCVYSLPSKSSQYLWYFFSLSHFRYKQASKKYACLVVFCSVISVTNQRAPPTNTQKSGKHQLCWALCMSKTFICRIASCITIVTNVLLSREYNKHLVDYYPANTASSHSIQFNVQSKSLYDITFGKYYIILYNKIIFPCFVFLFSSC